MVQEPQELLVVAKAPAFMGSAGPVRKARAHHEEQGWQWGETFHSDCLSVCLSCGHCDRQEPFQGSRGWKR